MNDAERNLAQARVEERVARARWFESLAEVQSRLAPSQLASDAWNGITDTASNVADKTVVAVKRRPAAMAAVGSAIGLFLLRRPIASAVRRWRSDDEETGPDARTLNDRGAAMPSLRPQPTMTEE